MRRGRKFDDLFPEDDGTITREQYYRDLDGAAVVVQRHVPTHVKDGRRPAAGRRQR